MKRLKKDHVLSFLKETCKTKKVYCPQWLDDRDLMLMPLGEGEYRGDIGKTTDSAKILLFPQTEEIISFRGQAISKVIHFMEMLVFIADVQTVVFVDKMDFIP